VPRPDPVEIERKLRLLLADCDAAIVAAYLFGSIARGTPHEHSDVDVGLLYREPPPVTLDALPSDLEADLQETLRAPVQVVVLNRAPADLLHRVFRDAKIVLDRDPRFRILFEVARRNEYFDLLPALQHYRRTHPHRT
jgi:predicted nucleotidyltransferase